MPRKPAQRPWLAMGVSRSTYYRRRKQAAQQAALSAATAARLAVLDRLDWMLGQMRAELDLAARFMVEGAEILAGLGASHDKLVPSVPLCKN